MMSSQSKAICRTLVLLVVAAAFVAICPRAARGQGGATLTNQRIVEMTKLGLSPDIIIAKIKTSTCKFSLTDSDLAELTKAGVSGKVVAAMIEASVIKSPRVKVDGKLVKLHTLGQAKAGGRLGSFMTGGIKSVKMKAYLPNSHSDVFCSGSNPDITLDLPRGDSIDNYMLVRMDRKKDRRELEVASVGGVVGAKEGIRAEAIVKTTPQSMGGNKYKLVVNGRLKRGEYLIYVVGSIDTIHGVYGKGYDFTVE